MFALEAMSVPVEYHHHEVGPSQHEIDLRYQEALRMADSLQTHKYLVKEVARRSGAFATFMPKPIAGENGSGMHVHLSIFKDSTNAFFDKKDEHHLSATAKHFIAGVLEHSREIALITNQMQIPTNGSCRATRRQCTSRGPSGTGPPPCGSRNTSRATRWLRGWSSASPIQRVIRIWPSA